MTELRVVRSINGANFVYFGMHLRDGQVPDPEIAALLKYARSIVSALSIHHGPSHMEVGGRLLYLVTHC